MGIRRNEEATSPPNSGTSSPPIHQTVHICASTRCYTGPRWISGATPNGRIYRSTLCILRRTGHAIAHWARRNITAPIESQAATIEEIIAELATTHAPERAGRLMDTEAEDSFEPPAHIRICVMSDPATQESSELHTASASDELIRVVILGHVDHGKSTLVGAHVS